MNLTRAEQDDIMLIAVASYRISHYHTFGWWPAPDDNEESFRAALRLDDDKLTRIINEHPGGITWTCSGPPR